MTNFISYYSGSEKLQYLMCYLSKNVLEGELERIGPLKGCKKHFKIAWDLLSQSFTITHSLLQEHTRALRKVSQILSIFAIISQKIYHLFRIQVNQMNN